MFSRSRAHSRASKIVMISKKTDCNGCGEGHRGGIFAAFAVTGRYDSGFQDEMDIRFILRSAVIFPG